MSYDLLFLTWLTVKPPLLNSFFLDKYIDTKINIFGDQIWSTEMFLSPLFFSNFLSLLSTCKDQNRKKKLGK